VLVVERDQAYPPRSEQVCRNHAGAVTHEALNS
jgi:hypothetical protein